VASIFLCLCEDVSARASPRTLSPRISGLLTLRVETTEPVPRCRSALLTLRGGETEPVPLKPMHIPTAIGAFITASIFTGVRMVDFDAVMAEATKDMSTTDAYYAKVFGPRFAKWVIPFAFGLLAFGASSVCESVFEKLGWKLLVMPTRTTPAMAA